MEAILFNNYKEIFGLIILLYAYNRIKPFLLDMKSLFVSWFDLNSKKRKKDLLDDLDKIKGEDPILEEILKHELNNIIHSNITGKNWNIVKQKKYANFYNQIKNNITSKEFKFLCKNSNINNGLLIIEADSSTKSDQTFRVIMFISLIVVSLILLVISLKMVGLEIYKQLIVMLLFVVLIFSNSILLIKIMSVKNLLKKIKKYNNCEL